MVISILVECFSHVLPFRQVLCMSCQDVRFSQFLLCRIDEDDLILSRELRNFRLLYGNKVYNLCLKQVSLFRQELRHDIGLSQALQLSESDTNRPFPHNTSGLLCQEVVLCRILRLRLLNAELELLVNLLRYFYLRNTKSKLVVVSLLFLCTQGTRLL